LRRTAPYRCNVDELLVVTFTEAAAAEMKERIARELRDRCATQPRDHRLRAQRALVDTAQISTLHAFCLWMVRRWFDRVGVDATAQLLDDAEGRLLRQESLAGLFNSLYAGESALANPFKALVEDYGLGYDGTIADFVLRLAAFAGSQDDPEAWLARARDGSPERLSRVMDDTAAATARELTRQVAHCSAGVSVIAERYEAGAFYGDLLANHAIQLATWAKRLDAGEAWENIRVEIVAYEISSKGAPRLPKGTPDEVKVERDSANDLFKEARDKLFKNRLRNGLCRFSAAEIAATFNQTAPYIATLVDLSIAFTERYARAKRALSVMDFADLERFAYQMLTAPDGEVARALRKRFAHVLVDEYQDINPLQAAILGAVSREGSSTQAGNLFTVGDVKQSIYRFRLAEPEMFLTRAQALDKSDAGWRIDLQKNFRSRRRILSAVNAVFEVLMRDDCGGIQYDERAALQPPSPETPLGEPIEFHVLERSVEVVSESDEEAAADDTRRVDPGDPTQWEGLEREAYWIGERIQELFDSGTRVGNGDEQRPLKYSDICVLLRSTRHSAAPLADMLRRMGIPVWTDSGSGLFDAREVRDVLALLAVLDNAQQDVAMASVLRSGILGDAFDEEELVKLRLIDRDASFHATLPRYADRGNDDRLQAKCAKVLRQIANYRGALRDEPLADVLWAILRDTGYFAYVGGLRDGARRRANLIALHERARQFGGFRRQGLSRFLRFIESLQAEGEDLAAPSGVGENEDVVRVMSMHKSKGLEFPIVIAAEMGRQFNLADRSGRFLFERGVGVGIKAVDRDRLIEYPTALHAACARAATEASLAEELRVWYVAMTRAREKLILVGTESHDTLEKLRTAANAGTGQVDPLRILGARSPLHWLIAAQGAMPRGKVIWDADAAPNDDTLFVCRRIDAEEIADWRVAKEESPGARELREAVGTLSPLPEAEPTSTDMADAERILDRLDFTYPHLAMSSLPAVRSASDARWADAGRAEEEPAKPLVALPRGTALERSEAARRGQVVHTALELMDLKQVESAAAIRANLDAMVARGTLAADDVELIDVDNLAWFFATPLGERIRTANESFAREWMFLSAEPIERFDATAGGEDSDRVLVRGVVDGVLATPEALEIVDYKTDRVTGADVQKRAEDYRMQMQLYAGAVARVYRREVSAAHLVFLHAREVVTITEGLTG
jgi:ATP-dependent helicase/nuclease subunit A